MGKPGEQWVGGGHDVEHPLRGKEVRKEGDKLLEDPGSGHLDCK